MTKKKRQEIDNAILEFKEVQMELRLAFLDEQQALKDLIRIVSTDEIVTVIKDEVEEPEPMSDEEKQDVIVDMVLTKNEI
jgi:hypothetical protein